MTDEYLIREGGAYVSLLKDFTGESDRYEITSDDVITQLIRLESVSSGRLNLKPKQRLDVGLEALMTSAYTISKQYGIDFDSVRHARRDVMASVLFLSGKNEHA